MDFIDYCKEHIKEVIYDYVGGYYYASDLPYEITQYENANGTLTFSRELAKEQLYEWWNDCAEYWEYEKSNFGKNYHNPFDEPEAYMVCMVIEGCASLLAQSELLQNICNNKFELTQEIADTIVEQVNEINSIW